MDPIAAAQLHSLWLAAHYIVSQITDLPPLQPLQDSHERAKLAIKEKGTSDCKAAAAFCTELHQAMQKTAQVMAGMQQGLEQLQQHWPQADNPWAGDARASRWFEALSSCLAEQLFCLLQTATLVQLVQMTVPRMGECR